MAEYEELMAETVAIADEAASIALSYFRQALLIEVKEDLSPVTVADKKTEEYIRETIAKRFPQHGIIGEEFGKSAFDSDFVWTVDPIDGTASFVRGIPLFGTLLGILYKGEPVVGVMVLPFFGEIYAAAKGVGAHCGEERLHVSTVNKLAHSFISIGDYHAFERAKKKKFFNKLYQESSITRQYTDCFGHAMFLRGGVDAMVDPIVSLWDIAPIACLVKEAGGVFFNFEGKSKLSTQSTQSFISAAPGLKKELLSLAK